MSTARADLHIHTYYSDGLMSPSEVVAEAAANGVGIISVTDHDTLLGVGEADKACRARGVALVVGTEISAYENGVKLHTLGYNVDVNSAVFKQFTDKLYEGSLKRAEDIIFKLNRNGVRLSMEEVFKERKCELAPVHAMYIARAGARKGYASNPFAFYLEYLASGKCGFSLIGRPSPEETIEAVNAAGGFASLAHPGRIELGRQDLLSLIVRLKGCGLCGIEGVYSTHTVTETAYYKELAKTYNLVVTGGSDAHYRGGNKRIGTPVFYPDEALARKIGI